MQDSPATWQLPCSRLRWLHTDSLSNFRPRQLGLEKLLATGLVILVIVGISYLVNGAVTVIVPFKKIPRAQFWINQGLKLIFAMILLIGVVSVWFDDPTRLTTAIGMRFVCCW